MTDTVAFIEETEIAERSLRRLADSRGCLLIKDGSEYHILGRGMSEIVLTDDECWDVLSAFPQLYTLSGKGVPVS